MKHLVWILKTVAVCAVVFMPYNLTAKHIFFERNAVCVNVINTCSNTDTTFADSTTFAGINTITGKSILVAGTYYVNGTLTLNNCTVYVNAGGQIIVQTNGNLILNSTTIQSCDTMWRGIEAINKSAVVMRNSVVEQAENGVLMRDGSRVMVYDSYFYDNIIGINAQPELKLTDGYGLAQLYVSGTLFTPQYGFKSDYVQQSAHGTVPLCGIWLNKMYCTIGDDAISENRIEKMIYGIYSESSNLTLTNSIFRGITNHNSWTAKIKGTAVVSWGNKYNTLASLTMRPVVGGGNTVEQCDRGIYATWSENEVSKVVMKQVLTGIYSANGKGRKGMYNVNSIYAVKYGIWLARNEGAKDNTVTGNNIFMQGSTKGIAILLDEWNNSVSANYHITGNHIELTAAGSGIESSYALQPEIHYNNIYQYRKGSSTPPTTGITLHGSDNAGVSCNYIVSDYPADSNFVSRGMEIAQSRNFNVNCNRILYQNCGVYMGGDCGQNNVYRTNNVDSCDMGLYLNTAAIIGQQMQKGNRWLHVLNKVNATNVGLPILSPIIVHTNVNTIWHPLNISPNGPWFQVKSGTPDVCGTDCYAAFTNSEDTLLLHNIARGDSLSTGFVDETKSIAQQNLYDWLDSSDTLRNSDSLLTVFYINNQSTSLGRFKDVKDYMQSASSISSYFIQLLQLNDSLILQRKDSISYADSMMTTDSVYYTDITQRMIGQMNTLQSNRKNLMQQIENIQSADWVNGKTINNIIQPSGAPEQNKKSMNDILAWLQEQNEDSIDIRRPEIEQIAEQCPYSGGVSVYQARNLLRQMNDSMDYDDMLSCLQEGIYRIAGKEPAAANYTAIDFDLVPNPADGKTEVRILTPVDGLTKLALRTMLGQMLDEWEVNKEKQFTIYTNKYLQGIYIVELKDETGSNRYKKLVIQR